MRLLTMLTTAGALALSAGAASAASVEIKDAVARVVVIPEARSDIKVEILTSHPSLPLQVRTQGERVIVDGDLDRRIRNCKHEGENARQPVLVEVVVGHDIDALESLWLVEGAEGDLR